jgi:transcriptional regulator with XRE-family HTH domain
VAWRTDEGLSRLAAARRLGVAHTTLRSWEVGSVCPQPLQLRLLAEALGADPATVRALAGPDPIRTVRTSGGHDASPLCRARLAAGLTMTQLSRKVGVVPATISRWENGVRTPSPEAQALLARSLRVTPEECTVMLAGSRPRRSDGVLLPGLGQLRRELGLTQRALRTAIGLGPSAANAWEHGRVRVPTGRLAAVAGALGVDPQTLVAAASRPPRDRAADRPLTGLRRAAGLTQREMAHHLGASVRTVAHWEAGSRTLPLSVARRLAGLLKVPLPTLLRAAERERAVLTHPRTWTPGNLPQVLTTLRVNAGWSAAALARRIGTSGGVVRGWERGGRLPASSVCARLELVYRLPRGVLTRLVPEGIAQRRSQQLGATCGGTVSSAAPRHELAPSAPARSART